MISVGKRVSESRVEQIQLIRPVHMNGARRLFGGQLMEWIDVAAALSARRHCRCEVTTACVDRLQFLQPAYEDDTVVLTAHVTYTGRTSMEVRVDSYVEALDGSRRLINTAYLIMVAVDKNGTPILVPPVLPETEEEKAEYAAGKARREARK
ncbi:MAG: acyl-CoA thioesterase [Eubacteriales bacterium]|nr:acyl-CoA thioesterase [Eubacteriales bacterium]